MNRIFGRQKPEAPQVNIGDVHSKVDGRVTDLDMKIATLDQELRKYKEQMAKTRGPALAGIKQRAMQTLKRKKMYETQRDSLAAQSFNIEQASFAIESTKDTLDTVSAMKVATVQLKAEHKKINLDELENLQDDMADLLEDMSEIQEALGRSYGIGADVDESELEAELARLEEEWAEEEQLAQTETATPSYLAPAQQHDLPSAPTALPARPSPTRTDEFGLPVPVATSRPSRAFELSLKGAIGRATERREAAAKRTGRNPAGHHHHARAACIIIISSSSSSSSASAAVHVCLRVLSFPSVPDQQQQQHSSRRDDDGARAQLDTTAAAGRHLQPTPTPTPATSSGARGLSTGTGATEMTGNNRDVSANFDPLREYITAKEVAQKKLRGGAGANGGGRTPDALFQDGITRSGSTSSCVTADGAHRRALTGLHSPTMSATSSATSTPRCSSPSLSTLRSEYILKVVLIGDSGVGKSNLVMRFTKNKYLHDSVQTVGFEFATKTIRVGDRRIKAQIWDTAGQERFQSLTAAYYRNAVGAMIVYDITNRSSFENVTKWLAQVHEHAHENLVLILFLETSALDATNVMDAFKKIIVPVGRLLLPSDPNDVVRLPPGWRRVLSRTRPGEYSYENQYTKERIAFAPKEPAKPSQQSFRPAGPSGLASATMTRENLQLQHQKALLAQTHAPQCGACSSYCVIL
ncbi:TPA: hypothetical protein N0F65_008690 [Lagenidium giganteum]|uniref:Uncharacterized protein n=1 Tax=Lagenidium giganteum TaxID=4803 RepID=A0AAV2Z846_9STRA|nr:TPA: hypothetical protein N0F65_008690 [Lagenidium giganteum]